MSSALRRDLTLTVQPAPSLCVSLPLLLLPLSGHLWAAVAWALSEAEVPGDASLSDLWLREPIRMQEEREQEADKRRKKHFSLNTIY